MVTINRIQMTQLARPAAWRGRVALIAKPGDPNTGVGRYVRMLRSELRAAGVDAVRIAPVVPPMPRTCYSLLGRLGMDLKAFLLNYPVWMQSFGADVYHLTSQNLASLLLFRRPTGHVVVTVHDIIPYMLRSDIQLRPHRTAADALFDRIAMAGLRRADHLIADSHYTRQCVVNYLGIDTKKISVAHLGIAHERFQPAPVPPEIRRRYGLPEGRRYLIYVGSEDPRKNLPTLLGALAILRDALPDVELIKVGRAHFECERQRLVDMAAQFNVGAAIHWLNDVPDASLPLLYNLADVCVMPSLYEGFGFPTLEAMACGTPAVCANAASLPEIVGNAGLLFECGRYASEALADALLRVLTDPSLYESLRAKGLAHAATFDWGQTARRTIDAYRPEKYPHCGIDEHSVPTSPTDMAMQYD